MTKKPPCNILLSSAGRRVALLRLFREALRELGLGGQVVAADCSRLSAAAHIADHVYDVPRCNDPAFVPRMLEICDEAQLSLIVPTIDTELPVYADNAQAFAERGCTVHVSSPETIAIAFDKRETHRWLSEQGFPTVVQGTPREVLAYPHPWTFPVIAKPARGSSSIGVVECRSPAELEPLVDKPDYIVQEKATGIELTVDTYIDRSGKSTIAVPRQRIETRAGEVSKGVTRHVPAVEELVSRLAEALPGAYGCINVQLFYDQERERISIIEINPRFGGGYPLAWQAGAHMPTKLIAEHLGLAYDFGPWEPDLVMLRFDDAVFVNEHEL